MSQAMKATMHPKKEDQEGWALSGMGFLFRDRGQEGHPEE